MYKKESKNPIYIQKEAKTPQYCISNISNIFASVEHDCTTPIKHPIKFCTNIKINVDRTKKKWGNLHAHWINEITRRGRLASG
jgi:hypothetical protein